jgi:hypothetical protein
VTQKAIESEYCLIDLPDYIAKKGKTKAEDQLKQLMLLQASNQRVMEEEAYSGFVKGLKQNADIREEEKFNRDKFEELRMLTNLGANKAR